MQTYEISFEMNGEFHSNLAIAESIDMVIKWYIENKPNVRIISIKVATMDSYKPGKPCRTIA